MTRDAMTEPRHAYGCRCETCIAATYQAPAPTPAEESSMVSTDDLRAIAETTNAPTLITRAADELDALRSRFAPDWPENVVLEVTPAGAGGPRLVIARNNSCARRDLVAH